MAVNITSGLEAFYVSYIDGAERREVVLSAPSEEKAREYVRAYFPNAKIVTVNRG